jgi:hypothetical protein
LFDKHFQEQSELVDAIVWRRQLRSNELQTRFLSEHLVNVPLVEAESSNGYKSLKPA